jgi:hypothetical protein
MAIRTADDPTPFRAGVANAVAFRVVEGADQPHNSVPRKMRAATPK